MLRRVLQELEAAQGRLDRTAISQKLGIEPSALDGMIDFWVQKGRVRAAQTGIEETLPCGGQQPLAGSGCGRLCSGVENCPFVLARSQGWELTP